MTLKLELYEGGNFITLGTPGYEARAMAESNHGYGVGGRAEAMLRHGYTKAEFQKQLSMMRLFAAAPDLLAAGEAMLAVLDQESFDPEDLGGVSHYMRAAVAKARGK